MAPTVRGWLRPRARIAGTALAAGGAVGLVATAADAALRGPVAAERTVFALGALALGVGTLGWSGSVVAGRGIEAMQEHLDARSDWTERDSRRAMTRVAGFGLGVMVGASVAAGLL